MKNLQQTPNYRFVEYECILGVEFAVEKLVPKPDSESQWVEMYKSSDFWQCKVFYSRLLHETRTGKYKVLSQS